MQFKDLSEIEVIQGMFLVIFVSVSVFIGLKILLRYFKVKRKELITVGLAWAFMSSPWWGGAVNFTMLLFLDWDLGGDFDIAIGVILVPIALICWIYSFGELVFPELTKKLTLIYTSIGTPYEIYLIYFIVTDISVIGRMTAKFNVNYTILPLLFIMFALVTVIFTSIFFSRKAFESDDSITKWKGRFFLLACFSFVGVSIFDAAVPMTMATMIPLRIILISSAFEYYLAFHLPDKLAKLLTKQK